MKKNVEHYPGEWDISVNNLRKLISGEGSLRAAFWGVWFLGAAILNILIILPLATYAGISGDSGPFNWFEKNNMLIIYPYMLFGYYVIIKNKICIKPYWVSIAKIFATYVMIRIPYDIYTNY